MGKITSIQDLTKGCVYFLAWGPTLVWKVVYLGCVFERGVTELLIAKLDKKNKWVQTNYPFADEIGIGLTKSEAIDNYLKFPVTEVKGSYKTKDELEKAAHIILAERF